MNSTFVVSTLLSAEKNFRPRETKQWILDNSLLLTCIAVTYVVATHAGRRWMLSRERMRLQPVLVVWNWALAVFSAIGSARILPDLVFVWRHYGFRSTVCDEELMFELATVNYWVWLYILSKGAELLDTVFVVLRKHPLTLLHWLHHVLAFLFAFYLGSHGFTAGRWFVLVNLVVHSVMYTYFALKAMDVRLPQVVAKTITLTQITHMAAGLTVSVSALWFYLGDRPCPGVSLGMCLATSTGYASFLFLFINFYRHRYRITTYGIARKTRSE